MFVNWGDVWYFFKISKVVVCRKEIEFLLYIVFVEWYYVVINVICINCNGNVFRD